MGAFLVGFRGGRVCGDWGIFGDCARRGLDRGCFWVMGLVLVVEGY